ncbi:hypothetical protein BDA99DRAFT_507974 [Phascolomyces articulosus]|uniref:DH domain-containing protein n=1 Tax=Phascolomyces articulosus TaxID=60185 RepID=A0AAD5K1Z1_9FUNG|nr:hypothetical protein BDA99DRAFT_507974 [Phascolomyces articulosus]
MAPSTSMKDHEKILCELGYKHQWKLVKRDDLPTELQDTPECTTPTTDEQSKLYQSLVENTKRPLCQNVDIIIPSDRDKLNRTSYEHLMRILGNDCPSQDPICLDTVYEKTDIECLAEIENLEYEENEEKRKFHIDEFIRTEKSYVNTLQAIVELIARPLNPQTLQYNGEQTIIDRFEHKKLFLNMEDILENTKRFMIDLEKCNPGQSAAEQEVNNDVCFGKVCESHMVNFECYRYYVLNRSFADQLHQSKYNKNGNNSYKRFLDSCYMKNRVRLAQKQMDELLGEPVQRIGRYTMMIKDILKHTSRHHVDYSPLTRAYIKACSIASMADDDATKLATTCYTIQQSVKYSPCNLMNQNRSFIAHLDAEEIHRVKGKTKRPVTLFLFADKLMIAERSNNHCKGIDICDNGKIPESGLMWNHSKKDSLKFKGWIDIEQVQLFEGAPGNPDSFTLFAVNSQKQDYGRGRGRRDPAPTTESHEEYFRRGLRLFTVIPSNEDERGDEYGSVSRLVNFISSFHQAQALIKRYEETDRAYYRTWCDSTTVYSNLYDTSSYTRANYKHNIAVVCFEEGKSVNLRPLFRHHTTAPWIVALVQGALDKRGFRYHIWSKIPLHPTRSLLENVPLESESARLNNKQAFQDVFWSNVLLCELHLRTSEGYTQAHREELDARPRSRSRSRSLTRSASIPTLPGWLGGNNNNQRSRSTSPSRAGGNSVKPTSSRSSPIGNGGRLSFSRKSSSSRSRSSSMTSSSSGTLARSLTKSTSSSTTSVGYDQQKQYYNNKTTQQRRTTLPPSLCLPTEQSILFQRPMVSSPQDDFDMPNKYSDSRPSSRSSTRSSTSSFPFNNNHAVSNGSFSNSVSLTSHSTRSSLSLEDLEMAKHSPSPPPSSTRMNDSKDEFSRRIQHLLSTVSSKNNNNNSSPRTAANNIPSPFNTHEEQRPNRFDVSSVVVGNNESGNRSTLFDDKCRMLKKQVNHLAGSAHSRAAQDPSYDVRRDFEEIKMSLSHIHQYRQERRTSSTTAMMMGSGSHSSTSLQSPLSLKTTQQQQQQQQQTVFDLDSFLARKHRQVHGERDYLDRSTNEFKNRFLSEMNGRQ